MNVDLSSTFLLKYGHVCLCVQKNSVLEQGSVIN